MNVYLLDMLINFIELSDADMRIWSLGFGGTPCVQMNCVMWSTASMFTLEGGSKVYRAQEICPRQCPALMLPSDELLEV